MFRHLCRLLSFEDDAQHPVPDLGTAEGEAFWNDAVAAALLPGLLPAVCYRRLRDYVAANFYPSPQVGRCAEGQARRFIASHGYRCGKQRERLLEALRALNAVGIAPVLMSGSRAIWLRDPAWQFVDRLPLVVPHDVFELASKTLQETGFRIVRRIDASGFRRDRHFFRPDLNGVLALRDSSSHAGLRQFLDGRGIAALEEVPGGDDARVLLPARHVSIVCDLLNRHVRRPRFGGSFITLKELYEFSSAVAGLDRNQRAALEALCLRQPELATTIAAWYVEANTLFGLRVPWQSSVRDRIRDVRQPSIETQLYSPEPWSSMMPVVPDFFPSAGAFVGSTLGKLRSGMAARFEAFGAVRRREGDGKPRRDET